MNEELKRDFVRNEDGSCQWVYEYSMYENKAMLWTVFKIIGISMVVICLIFLAVVMSSGRSFGEFAGMFGVVALILLFILIISVGSYYGVAAMYGGRYTSVFTMDETALTHYQPAQQAKKERTIGTIAAAAGMISGNPGTMIAGLTRGSRVVVRYYYDQVRSMKMCPEKDEIRMHSFMTWSTVYVPKEEFEFVAEFLTRKCTHARVKRKG